MRARHDADQAKTRSDWENCEYVVVWADFISHAVTDRANKGKTVVVHGGMGKIREALEEVFIVS